MISEIFSFSGFTKFLLTLTEETYCIGAICTGYCLAKQHSAVDSTGPVDPGFIDIQYSIHLLLTVKQSPCAVVFQRTSLNISYVYVSCKIA